MTEINPFAAPQSDWAAPGGDSPFPSEIWRAGKVLVFTHGASLPERCIKCNTASDVTMTPRKLYYYPPWIYILILVNLLVLLLVAVVARKTSTATLGLCNACRRRRRNAIVIAWLCILGAIATPILLLFVPNALWPQDPNLVAVPLILATLALFVTALVFGGARGQLLTVQKIDKQQVRLTRISTAYLDMLPIGP